MVNQTDENGAKTVPKRWVPKFACQHDAETETPFPMFMYDIPDAPWSLRLFGESSRYLMKVPDSEKYRARELFPERFSR
jgi:hypothetical protein